MSWLRQDHHLHWPTSLAGCWQDKWSPWPLVRTRGTQGDTLEGPAVHQPQQSREEEELLCASQPAQPLGTLHRKGNLREMRILRPEETTLTIWCGLPNTLGAALHPVIPTPDLFGCFQMMLTLILYCNVHTTKKTYLRIYKSLPCRINPFTSH